MALKRNSKRVLDIVAGQKKQNVTEAYRQVHPDATDNTARSNAWKLMQKPEAHIYLQQHIDKARNTIVSLTDSDKDEIRLRASQDILDREHGKATTVTEVKSTGVTINIDLASALALDSSEDES